ncbi:MAG: serine/threonine protein kinase, partial [Acidobacteria bacterium]|nr:serine/threonine protein kinase [Acidobacteriota bacterium]
MQHGSRLGPYEIVSPLGAGGMGEVYKARDTRLDRLVAIKVLPAAVAGDSGRLARFEREAKAVAALSHPNILAIHDFHNEGGGTVFAVMELLDGQTLRERLDTGPLPPRRAVDCAAQIARGLAAAHRRGIVHRDLKPENLFLCADGRVKILDFGLAKLAAGPDAETLVEGAPAPGGTGPGVVLGTAGYMSPEQVRGQAADSRSDLFSLGAVLYEMLAGQRAFPGGSAADTMSAILREDPPALAAVNPHVPPGLERVVAHCLEKSPEQRCQSAQDLAFDLETLSGVSGTAGTGAGSGAVARRLPLAGRRRMTRRAALAALAVAALLGSYAAVYLLAS